MKWLFVVAAMCALVLLGSTNLLAQDDSTPKYDVFAGYQWLHPGQSVNNTVGTPPTNINIHDMKAGFGFALTRNFTRPFGMEFDFGHNQDNFVTTLSAGPRLLFPSEHADFFIHALVGLNRAGIDHLGSSSGIGGILGGGFDLKITPKLSWRVIEGDYMPSHHNFGQVVALGIKKPDLNGTRVRTGLVWNFGYPETTPVGASVRVTPDSALTGTTFNATATANNFNPKHTLKYDWSSSCGKITGSGTTATIDTTGVPGGNCTTTVRVTDPQAKKNNTASASAGFAVTEPPKNPPTMSCSASPSSVQAGRRVTVTCSCQSPDNVPVSVSNYTASSGSISGSGNNATLNTNGAAPGTITINASCSDQRGLSTSASTQVTIENPPPAQPDVRQLEQRLSLHSIYFATAQPTKEKPEGGLVASQQDTLGTLAEDFKKYLQARPNAHLILEGHTDPRGSAEYNQALSERRVGSARHFLVAHGVPDANIETKGFGLQQQLTSDQVKESVDQNSELTPGERKRIMTNMRTVILASNRRVDVRLNTTNQESVRQFPFSATDSLTLLGGREKPAAKPAAKPAPKAPAKAPAKKAAPKAAPKKK